MSNLLLLLPQKEQQISVLLATVLMVFVFFILVAIGFSPGITIGFALISITALFIYNFKIVYLFFIGTFFINYLVLGMKISVLFAIPLLISFVLTQRKISSTDFKNPLNKYIALYLAACVPSLFFVIQLWGSLLISLNFFALLVVMYLTSIYFRDKEKLQYVWFAFIGFSLLNAMDVSRLFLEGYNRPFGFAGIMFVDFVNLAFIISLISWIFKPTRHRSFYAILCLIFLAVSLLMQTRNSLLALFGVGIFLVFSFLKNSEKLNLNRKKIIISVSIAAAFFLAFIVVQLSAEENILTRFTQIQIEEEQIEGTELKNSLLTRLIIWHTGWNAFISNPIWGIGFYSFPLSSHQYYEVPKIFYENYVENLTPHVGYYAVLIETGIVGLIAFSIFIISIIRVGRSNFRFSKTRTEIYNTLVINWGLLYIAISLFMTDAWLWGSGGMVWGMFLGLTLANNKRLIYG